MDNVIPQASVEAYRQLLVLNLESWKPEVADWLHSKEAKAVLADILLHVPCAPTIH